MEKTTKHKRKFIFFLVASYLFLGLELILVYVLNDVNIVWVFFSFLGVVVTGILNFNNFLKWENLKNNKNGKVN